MTTLDQILANFEGQHLKALRWFEEKRGRRVSWKEMKVHAETGARLSTAAKGIYKPKYMEFALSVRTVQDGPYPDKEVEYRPDGSWVCNYFQENKNPELRDKEATNRGLMLCLERKVPVGFLIKRKSKPGVEYDVLGLGLVTAWEHGYFTIEGFASDGSIDRSRASSDAALARLKAFNYVGEPSELDLPISIDLRERELAIVALRRGQAAFRTKLMEAYCGCCCVTGCDVPAALEAAHIMPYRGRHSNIATNGLLLRSDVHSLFDQGLLALDDNFKTLLAPNLTRSDTYKHFDSEPIRLPLSVINQPNKESLRQHREWTGL